MAVELTQEAGQYIRENGGSAMILLGSITGCCGGKAPMPQIHLGIPKNLLEYEQESIGGINIYIDKLIDNNSRIEISLSKLLWLKGLSLDILED